MSQCYRHLRLDEREIVFRMKDAWISVSKIAAQLFRFATSLTRPVQNLQIELRFAFRCHQAHSWAGSGFRDGLRFPVVGLQRFDIGLDIFRRHLSHRVPMRLEGPTQKMRAAARLHRHHALRQLPADWKSRSLRPFSSNKPRKR
jgi:hypothetical protein